MICNNCGKDIEDNALFCPVCGNRVEAAPPEAPIEQPVTAPEPKERGFFGVGAFVLCLVVIGLLAGTAGTFAFLYFSAIGAV